MIRKWVFLTAAVSCWAQQPAAAPARESHAGCLVFKDAHVLLVEEKTQDVIELNGPDLALNLGNRVEVEGTAGGKPAVQLATRVMNVSSVSPRNWGGCLTVAASIGARTSMPPRNLPAGVGGGR